MRLGTPKSWPVFISAKVSLGKQEPPKPGPGVQELGADAVVEADAARHVLHVGAGPFAQIGDLVDEGDLRGQKGVGGILDELCGATIREQHRRLIEIERAVDVAHHFAGAVVFGADDDAVGPLEVGDGRPLAQKFRVGDDGEATGWAAASAMMRATSSPVPTGTVDLVAITL